MKTAAEYREFAAKYREMAAKMTDPQDREALELQASAWEKVASAREAALKKNDRHAILFCNKAGFACRREFGRRHPL